MATNNKVIRKQIVFTYQGLNRRGGKIKGEIYAASASEAKGNLKKQGITPTKVRKKPQPLFGSGGKPIDAKDIAVFTRQVATMLTAGVPLVQSLDMIAKGADKQSMSKLVQDVLGQVQAGSSVADALRTQPKYFDDLYCDLVESGEKSGALDGIFDRIALYKEKSEALKSKIKKAMTYPIAILSISFIVVGILLVVVIPSFEDIFKSFGADLPGPTMTAIAASEVAQDYWAVVVAGIIIAVFLFKRALRTNAKFAASMDALLLKAPIVGNIVNKGAIARYARTLSTTFAAGVPLHEALNSAAGASGNAVYKKAIQEIKADVSAGNLMHVSMRATNLFPDMVTQMVSIGEESGALDTMLERVANVYEQEVDDAVDGITALIEPFIMVFLGTVIGGLIVVMYLPIFQMGNAV
ncbi:type II secretion system F family protein [Psychrosphaera sp. B3R10]|uniref:type II secretion system F family protein n=1 Tax=unclassified Psychrosphaera TaxID=2641570 RepID=UPI001C0938FD|nr:MULTISPECIES: type II secretion system F family protein [unclassified Psychrosphaera]MBU2882509.1 type II secretion system F family protein [Psychrosphaera sp. I2R16]MBU2989473.1 type II secretion system F family protein [Psychrosphaera sp. B3R10]MDO6718307.1 type II secretion system F family protein [Psychrosphaera sp. 1_MG-2023]